MKKVLIIVGVLVVLLLVGGFIFVNSLDGIVRSQVETNTTQSLDLRTTLAGADVGLFSGDVALNELAVDSPEGFNAPSMFSVGGLDVETSYGKLFGDPVRVDAITIQQPKIVLEQKGTNFNFKVLAEKFKDSGGDTSEPSEEDGDPVKVIIDRLTVTDAQVELRSDFLSEPKSFSIKTFTLNNIGNADEAQTGAELGRVVMEVVGETAKQVAANEDLGIPPEVRALLAGDLAAIRDQLETVAVEQLNDVLPQEVKDLLGEGGVDRLLEGKLPEDLGEDLRGRAEDEVKNRLGDLLGGNKSGDNSGDAAD